MNDGDFLDDLEETGLLFDLLGPARGMRAASTGSAASRASTTTLRSSRERVAVGSFFAGLPWTGQAAAPALAVDEVEASTKLPEDRDQHYLHKISW
ncbi:MAG TPA: hypothetical protein PKE00_06495 [Planctomycetota bacterium]|nr:hypothetical protein [Planctomycetota bacterium]